MNDFIALYTFGNTVISIRSPQRLKQGSSLEPFFENGAVSYDFQIKVEVIPPTTEIGRLTPAVKRQGNEITVSIHEDDMCGIGAETLLSLADASFLFLEKNGFILHSSFIIYKNSAILFSAPSGVGKSTQAELWEKHLGAEVINGDRALLYKENGVYFASGVYTSGSSGICKNKKAPLRAVVLLEQGETCEIYKCSAREYIRRVIGESSYDVSRAYHQNKITQLAVDLLSEVEVLCYKCTLDLNSAECLENYLWNREKR